MENFLKEVFADSYTGIDDPMSDAFDDFLANLDGEEYISYADEFALKQYNKGVSDTFKKLEEEKERVVLDLQEAKENNIKH